MFSLVSSGVGWGLLITTNFPVVKPITN